MKTKSVRHFLSVFAIMLILCLNSYAQSTVIGPIQFRPGKSALKLFDMADYCLVPAVVNGEAPYQVYFPKNIRYLKIEDSSQPLFFDLYADHEIKNIYIGRTIDKFDTNRWGIDCKKVILGKNLKELIPEALNKYNVFRSTDTIIALSEIPIPIPYEVTKKMTVLVPKGAASSYQNAAFWKEMNIVEKEEPTEAEKIFEQMTPEMVTANFANFLGQLEQKEMPSEQKKVILDALVRFYENTDPAKAAELKEKAEKSGALAYDEKIKAISANPTPENCNAALEYFVKLDKPDYSLKVLEIYANSEYGKKDKDILLKLGLIYRNGEAGPNVLLWGIKTATNKATAMKWFQKAREAGSVGALFFMADLYWTGGNGIVKNRVQAAKLYQELVKNHGDVSIGEASLNDRSIANYRYGYCLENGIGVLKNIPLAHAYYKDSYEADAYYRSGVLVEKRFVEKDLWPSQRRERLDFLYRTAAEKGHQQAKQALNRLYR